MFRNLALASLMLAFSAAAHASSFGACAWAQLPPEDHQAVLNAYRTGIQSGMSELAKRDAQARAAVDACTHQTGVPKLWTQAAVASEVIQEGAAIEIASAGGPDRDHLDAAWRDAPAASRECFRANASKAFGVPQGSCPDMKAPLWFLQRFGISPSTQRTLAFQLLTYFNAKAQGEWADALVSRFVDQHAGGAD